MKIVRSLTAAGLTGSALLVGGISLAGLATAPAAMAAPRMSPAANIVEYGAQRPGVTAIEYGTARGPGATVIEY